MSLARFLLRLLAALAIVFFIVPGVWLVARGELWHGISELVLAVCVALWLTGDLLEARARKRREAKNLRDVRHLMGIGPDVSDKDLRRRLAAIREHVRNAGIPESKVSENLALTRRALERGGGSIENWKEQISR